MAKRSRENVYCAESARYVVADGNAIAGVTPGAQSSLADAILDVVDLLRERNRMRTWDMSSSLAESNSNRTFFPFRRSEVKDVASHSISLSL